MTAATGSLPNAGPSPARSGELRSSPPESRSPVSGLSGGRAGRAHLSAQLLVVMGASPSGHYLHAREELRRNVFRNYFAPIGRVQDRRDHPWTEWLPRVGARATIYLACAPRSGRVGGKAGVERVECLWADCDTDAALDRLAVFRPQPSLTIASGGHTEKRRPKLHCYWRLNMAATPETAGRALKALQRELGSDPRCAESARVLRPIGSTWRKDGVVRLVELVHVNLSAVYPLERIVPRDLLLVEQHKRPRPHGSRANQKVPKATFRGRRVGSSLDSLELALKAIEPAEYIEALTGERPSEAGKVHCPFHPDWNPSFHVYPTAEEGWTCFQCPDPPPGKEFVGGTVIDLGARLYGLDPRTEYPAILRRLARDLLGERQP
jgi:hypothetical protein